MKKDVYRYWAIFHYAEDGISVSFPDLLGCLTCAVTAEEAHAATREALEGFIYSLELDGDDIPEPTSLQDIFLTTEKNEAVIEVQVYMPTIREAMENKAIKKTLTVPKWLNDAAEIQNLNFS